MKAKVERIITVGRFSYSRALLLQALLQSESVECFIVNKESMQSAGEVELRVRESDVPAAVKIIDHSVMDAGQEKDKALSRMLQVRRILVPVDFSNASVNASKFAITLAQQFKAEVRLFHVYYNPAIDIAPYNDHYAYQLKLINSLREIEKGARDGILRFEEKLKTWAKKEGCHDVRINVTLANGHAAEEILTFSKKYRPAVIVMANRGLSKKGTNDFGRITRHVLENSIYPVLTLPEKKTERIENFHNILFSAGYEQTDFASLNRLVSMVKPFGATIHCVHISIGTKKAWEDVKMEELEEHMARDYADAKVVFHTMVSDDVSNGLEAYIRNYAIDVIAATTHKRQLIEKMFSPSLTRKLFVETGKPLLAFHAS